MLLSVFGTPSPLTYWTLYAIQTIARVLDPNAGYMEALRFKDLQPAWDAIDAQARKVVVFYSSCPDFELSNLFLSTQQRIIFTADDPADIVPFSVLTRDMSVENALRFASQSISTLGELSCGPMVMEVRNEQYGGTVRQYVQRIIGHFDLTLDENQTEEILSYLIDAYVRNKDSLVGDEIVRSVPSAQYPGAYTNLVQSQRDLVYRVGNQYAALLHGQPFERVIWPREMFYDLDRNDVAIGPQSMVGPARCLIFGPYLHLPKGEWDVTIEFEVDENHSGNDLVSDVVCNGSALLRAFMAPLPKRGIFAFNIGFEVVDPLFPIEIRIHIRTGAIEGVLLLRKAEFQRAGEGVKPVQFEGSRLPFITVT